MWRGFEDPGLKLVLDAHANEPGSSRYGLSPHRCELWHCPELWPLCLVGLTQTAIEGTTTLSAIWQWEQQSRSYGNYGNANQWTVNAGLTSLARESAQNSSDARPPDEHAELVYTFIRLTGKARADFEDALGWNTDLRPHLEAMAQVAEGAVSAGQIKAGLEALDSTGALVLLRIADYGCAGLTGPEFPDDTVTPDKFGNFIKLCRLDLFSGKDQASGGSFGLGKAVYWRFSRLQTVLFNSTLPKDESVNGNRQDRLIGINQGVLHRLGGTGFQGRGYFGAPDNQGDVASVWGDADLVGRLHLERPDSRPGTSGLLVGFYDPDQPEHGLNGAAGLISLAQELRRGLEESFWPLLTRERMRVRLEVIDDGQLKFEETVDPEDTYPELVRALKKFDKGEVEDNLEAAESIVVRDVPITVSARVSKDPHESFVHHAKLVVTLSDNQPDSLENRVCLLRRPEMVVQTVDKTYEGRTYHAFLLAGVAINPDNPSLNDLRADDFLRFAEPPSHDRWIPGTGRAQTSQANLTAHYKAPWLPNLRQIERGVLDALLELFGAPAPSEDKPPEAIFKHLKFLHGESGVGGTGSGAPHKPEVEIVDGKVKDGRWAVTFQVRARNRPEGWSVEPCLTFVGLDGTHTAIAWSPPLKVVSGGSIVEGRLVIPGTQRGRVLKATVEGVSVAALPIPAEEAAVEVRLGSAEPATPGATR